MNDVAKIDQDQYAIMEMVIAKGDLSKLTSQQRVSYYNKVCESIGVNPLTRPFQYITFDGKLVLYAAKDCSEQLRTIKGISITKMEKEVIDGVYLVTSYALDKTGRTDVSTGAVTIKGLSGKALANAYKIAETQSKRRVTLSISGLGFLDDSETSDVPNATKVEVDFETGEIKQALVEQKWDKEILVGEGAPHKDELVQALKECETIDSLKDVYAKAYTLHRGNLLIMKDITELKDKRKAEILQEQHGDWLAEASIIDTQGDGA